MSCVYVYLNNNEVSYVAKQFALLALSALLTKLYVENQFWSGSSIQNAQLVVLLLRPPYGRREILTATVRSPCGRRRMCSFQSYFCGRRTAPT